MESYIGIIKTLTDNLAASGTLIDEEDLVLYTLNGLPQEYGALCTYVRARPVPITLEDLNNLLLSEEIYVLKQTSAVSGLQPSNFQLNKPTMVLQTTRSHFQVPRGSGSGIRNRLNYRGVRYRVQRGRGRGSTFVAHYGQICGRTNHSALDCYYRNDSRYQPNSSSSQQQGNSHQALMASAPPIPSISTGTPSPNNNWFFDSGATHHITNGLGNLSVHDSYQGFDNVSVGNGATIPIQNTGSGQVFEENSVRRTQQGWTLSSTFKQLFSSLM